MGRPKVHASNVERQRAYRAKRKAEKDARPKKTHLQRFRRKLVDLAAEAEMFRVDPIEVEVALKAMVDHYGLYVYRRATGDPLAEQMYDRLRIQGEGPIGGTFEEAVEKAKAERAAWESWEEGRKRKDCPEQAASGDGDPVEQLQGLLTGRP